VSWDALVSCACGAPLDNATGRVAVAAALPSRAAGLEMATRACLRGAGTLARVDTPHASCLHAPVQLWALTCGLSHVCVLVGSSAGHDGGRVLAGRVLAGACMPAEGLCARDWLHRTRRWVAHSGWPSALPLRPGAVGGAAWVCGTLGGQG